MNLDGLLREILLSFSVRFLSAMRISQTVLFLADDSPLSNVSSASSEDTPSSHEIGRISAEVFLLFSDDDESSLL